MRDRAIGRALGALVTALWLVLALSASAIAADNKDTIKDFTYQPKSITVNVGDSVTWRNLEAYPHSATADDGSFDTGLLSIGQTATVVFPTAGTFAYKCSIHPEMVGTVVVEAPGAVPATDTDPAPTAPSTGVGVGGSVPLALVVLAGILANRLIGRRNATDVSRG